MIKLDQDAISGRWVNYAWLENYVNHVIIGLIKMSTSIKSKVIKEII